MGGVATPSRYVSGGAPTTESGTNAGFHHRGKHFLKDCPTKPTRGLKCDNCQKEAHSVGVINFKNMEITEQASACRFKLALVVCVFIARVRGTWYVVPNKGNSDPRNPILNELFSLKKRANPVTPEAPGRSLSWPAVVSSQAEGHQAGPVKTLLCDAWPEKRRDVFATGYRPSLSGMPGRKEGSVCVQFWSLCLSGKPRIVYQVS